MSLGNKRTSFCWTIKIIYYKILYNNFFQIINTTQEKIINLIKKNPTITQIEMAEILDLTRDGISYNIKVLKEKVQQRMGIGK